MLKITITHEQYQGYVVGLFIGVAAMTAASYHNMERTKKDEIRAVAFANRLVEESWVYLPTESKDKFVDEIQFFNISVREGI